MSYTLKEIVSEDSIAARVDELGKEISRHYGEEPGEEAEVYHERVRLYGPDELAGLAAEEGLVPRSRYGDYDGGPFRGADSPRGSARGRRRRRRPTSSAPGRPPLRSSRAP